MSATDQQVLQRGAALIELVLPAVPASVAMARGVLHAAAERAGFPAADSGELAVAVCEAMTNAVLHAGATVLTVRYQVAEDEVVADVEDDGGGFDTAVIERAYVPGETSGRGTLLMRGLVDALQYASGPGGTVVRLVKRRPDVPSSVVPWPGASRPRRAIGHLKQTIHRYQRDVQLMTGQIAPAPDNLDDLTIMEAFAAARNKDGLIGDRKLRIKTLEATLEILQEGVE